MKTKILLLMLLCPLILFSVNAQTNIFPSTGAAGIGTTTPDASSLLEIKSTKKGMLIPRMSKNQRDAIPTPATGLLIYQTNSTPGFYYYDGSAWKPVTPKNAGTSLSNLTTTAVDSSLIPGINNSISLGSSSLRWKDVNLYNLKFSNRTIQTTAFVPYSAGTGLSLSGTTFTNTAPDKIVTLTGGGGTTVSGTYPNFTISSSSNSYYLSTTISNTSVGFQSLSSNQSGNGNTSTGVSSLYSNTTGSSNTATGHQALFSNDFGNNNAAYGESSLYSNDGGNFNTAIGTASLFGNNSGNYNTATGAYALTNNYASNNTATGAYSLYSNGSGTNNTASGFQALYSNNGSYNTASGGYALYKNTRGNYNTALGVEALYSNDTGYNNIGIGTDAIYSSKYGIDNIGIGNNSLYANTTGSQNVALGNEVLFFNTTGYYNTVIGDFAMEANVQGANNTAVGIEALGSNQTGSYLTAVGSGANITLDALEDATVIGAHARVNASGKCSIGDQSMAVIGGAVGWSTFLDQRFQSNIKENVPGLAFINKLKPVTYNMELRKIERFLGNTDSIMKPRLPDYVKGEQKVHSGFIVEDVEKTAQQLGYDFDGINHPQNQKDNYSLVYDRFIPPLVKAVQELSAQNDSLKNENAGLQKQFNDLKTLVLSIQQKQESCSPCNAGSVESVQPSSVVLTDAASLQQNIPNPFTHTTTIAYTLPQKFTNAQIVITDKLGNTLRAINISGSGKGNLNVDASTLSSGAYQYSLIVDGRLIATKQLIIAR